MISKITASGENSFQDLMPAMKTLRWSMALFWALLGLCLWIIMRSFQGFSEFSNASYDFNELVQVLRTFFFNDLQILLWNLINDIDHIIPIIPLLVGLTFFCASIILALFMYLTMQTETEKKSA